VISYHGLNLTFTLWVPGLKGTVQVWRVRFLQPRDILKHNRRFGGTCRLHIRCHKTLRYSKNAVFWDVTQCGSCKNRRFGATCPFHIPGNTTLCFLKNVVFWVVTPRASCKDRHFGGTLCLQHQGKRIRELETLGVLTKATVRQIAEDGIRYSHRRENLISDIALTGWTL
jgi:hypothetical protein